NARAFPEKLSNLLGVGSQSALSAGERVVHVVGLAAVVTAVAIATFALVGALRPLLDRSPVERAAAGQSRWLDDGLVLALWGGIGCNPGHEPADHRPHGDVARRPLAPVRLLCLARLVQAPARQSRTDLPGVPARPTVGRRRRAVGHAHVRAARFHNPSRSL